VAFISDSYGEWPFSRGSRADLTAYTEVTDQIIEQLVEAGILRDEGIAWADEAEPQAVYERAVRNVWMD